MTELAYRENDGIQVSLLWDPRTGCLTVAVCDTRSGERFRVPAPGDCALEVFNHPFAYWAFGVRDRETELAACA